VPKLWSADRRTKVLDLIFVVIGIGFFAACGLYLYACDRL